MRDYLLMQQAWVERKGKLPEPRPLVLNPVNQATPELMFKQFMREFDGLDATRLELPSGDLVTVDDSLFKKLNGDWKIEKRGRDQWLLYLAELIKSPQEIWKLKPDFIPVLPSRHAHIPPNRVPQQLGTRSWLGLQPGGFAGCAA